jgi:cephalosporin hydroxylase
MNPIEEFETKKAEEIVRQGCDADLVKKSRDWMVHSSRHNYTYHFHWLGRPVIQFPQDILALQEIIWRVRPEVIVETGIAHGGSLIFSASMLELMGGEGRVVGVDIDIRAHNRAAIEQHPLARRIDLVQGSSIAPETIEIVKAHSCGKKVLVILDSNHTHAHVLDELRAYAPLVSKGSYLVVFDTSIEDAPPDCFTRRTWGKGNNPKTAVHAYLKESNRFEIDRELESKLLITVAPDGYLKCIRD